MTKTKLNSEQYIQRTFSGLSNLRLEPLSAKDKAILNSLPEIVKVTYLGDDYFSVNHGIRIVAAIGYALDDLFELPTPENLKCIDINELNNNRY